MIYYDAHLSDEELILSADGELSGKREARVRAHLAACWTCRSRLKHIEGTIGALVRLYHQDLDSQVPPSAGPRALLKARLAELAAESRPNQMERLFQSIFSNRVPVYILGAVFLVAICTTILVRYLTRNGDLSHQ